MNVNEPNTLRFEVSGAIPEGKVIIVDIVQFSPDLWL